MNFSAKPQDGSGVSLRSVWLGVLALFVAARIAISANGAELLALISAVLAHNLVYWLAFVVIFVRLWRIPPGTPADRVSLGIFAMSFAALLVLGLVGIPQLDGLAAGLIATALLVAYRQGPDLRAAGFIFLALFLNLFAGNVIFALLKPQIILVDTILTEATLRLTGHEVVRNLNAIGTGDGHRIAVIGACSAFNNITLAALAMVSGLFWIKDRLSRSDVWPIAAICLVMLAFNTARLSLFSISRAGFEYWHGGSGAPILAMIQTFLLFAMVLFVMRQQHPQWRAAS